ncbi:MAG: single-stranded DNA-binding protein [Candidatus Portnoybacteria bacterium]|nr:single-stranded DNA-binding protein [Candidatus Portnoybacteria bacterium]
MNLNKVIIVGRLTRDPESRAMPSGKSVVSLGIATNSFWTDASGNKKEATEYHNIVVFGKLADTCSQYLTKGQLILVEGRIQTRSWDDQSGNKKYKTEIIANNMQMGPRPGGSQATPNRPAPAPAPVSQEDIPVINAEEPMEVKNEVDVESIPF